MEKHAAECSRTNCKAVHSTINVYRRWKESLPECQVMKLQQRFTSVLHRWNARCYAVAPNFSSVDKRPQGPFSWLNENLKTQFKGLIWTRWRRMMRPSYKNSKFSCMRSSSYQMFNLITWLSESFMNNQLMIIQLRLKRTRSTQWRRGSREGRRKEWVL